MIPSLWQNHVLEDMRRRYRHRGNIAEYPMKVRAGNLHARIDCRTDGASERVPGHIVVPLRPQTLHVTGWKAAPLRLFFLALIESMVSLHLWKTKYSSR